MIKKSKYNATAKKLQPQKTKTNFAQNKPTFFNFFTKLVCSEITLKHQYFNKLTALCFFLRLPKIKHLRCK